MHPVVIAVYLRSNTQQHSNSSTHALDELLGTRLCPANDHCLPGWPEAGLRRSVRGAMSDGRPPTATVEPRSQAGQKSAWRKCRAIERHLRSDLLDSSILPS